jgi:BMFP domain-containing protein YqiC
MTKNNTTIDELARMINEGFMGTASKEDMTEVKEEMKAMEARLTTRLDRIEHLLLAKQEQRLNELETRMKNLEDALAV